MSVREAKPEEMVAAWVDGLLRARGWVVLVVERTVHRCPHCGKRATDVNVSTGRRGRYHDGTSKGLPDRAYFHPSKCDTAGIVPVELKGPDTPWSSKEQREAFEAGQFLVVRGSKKRHGFVTADWVGVLTPAGAALVRDLAEIMERVA